MVSLLYDLRFDNKKLHSSSFSAEIDSHIVVDCSHHKKHQVSHLALRRLFVVRDETFNRGVNSKLHHLDGSSRGDKLF